MLEIPSSRQFTREELMEPRVSMEDILAVQSLALGYLRRRARTRKNDSVNRHHGFAMYDTDSAPDEFYDGGRGLFLSCLVNKVHYDQWRMRVRFKSMVNSEEVNKEYSVDDYVFDWLRNGNRMAWAWTSYKIYDNDGEEYQTTCNIHPTEAEECERLKLRMLGFSEKVNPLLADSIYRPEPGTNNFRVPGFSAENLQMV